MVPAPRSKDGRRVVRKPQADGGHLIRCWPARELLIAGRPRAQPRASQSVGVQRVGVKRLERPVCRSSLLAALLPKPRLDPLHALSPQCERPRHCCSRQPSQHPQLKHPCLALRAPAVCVLLQPVACCVHRPAPTPSPHSSPARRPPPHPSSSAAIAPARQSRVGLKPIPRSFACAPALS